MQNVVETTTATAVVPNEQPIGAEAETERTLTTEITELWAIHAAAQTTAKKTSAELKEIRQSLGLRLFEMKQLLAKPGRSGGWSGFLASHGFSRTTADRLSAAHARSIGPENRTDGADSGGDPDFERLVKTVSGRVSKILTTPSFRYDFIRHLAIAFGLDCTLEAHSVVLLEPASDGVATTAASG